MIDIDMLIDSVAATNELTRLYRATFAGYKRRFGWNAAREIQALFLDYEGWGTSYQERVMSAVEEMQRRMEVTK